MLKINKLVEISPIYEDWYCLALALMIPTKNVSAEQYLVNLLETQINRDDYKLELSGKCQADFSLNLHGGLDTVILIEPERVNYPPVNSVLMVHGNPLRFYAISFKHRSDLHLIQLFYDESKLYDPCPS